MDEIKLRVESTVWIKGEPAKSSRGGKPTGKIVGGASIRKRAPFSQTENQHVEGRNEPDGWMDRGRLT